MEFLNVSVGTSPPCINSPFGEGCGVVIFVPPKEVSPNNLIFVFGYGATTFPDTEAFTSIPLNSFDWIEPSELYAVVTLALKLTDIVVCADILLKEAPFAE